MEFTLNLPMTCRSSVNQRGGVRFFFADAGVNRPQPLYSRVYSASYSGDANFLPATSAQISISLFPPMPTVTLAAGNIIAGLPNTLRATLSDPGATGTVTFKDGGVVPGTVCVVNGVATLTHTFTTTGSHSIVAEYSGDAGHQQSSSPVVVVQANINLAPILMLLLDD